MSWLMPFHALPSRPIPAVISTARERSHAALSALRKASSLGNTRFLASLRNDSGVGIMTFAISGTTRSFAVVSTCPRGHLDRKGEISSRPDSHPPQGKISSSAMHVCRKIDVRILAVTARDLATEVQLGRFREDLNFHLNVIRIVIPPLCRRRSDIPLLSKIKKSGIDPA